ncbi:MAG TPA: tetratricopeptide repeat protein [Pelolinea sp.]|nr:tetratricopeptide repeat protein [Pelolinea sp.]
MKKTGIGLIIVLLILLSACRLPFSIVLNEETPSAEENSAFDIAEILKPLVKATPTPKLSPTSKLDLADYALFAGDLDSAIERFQEIFDEESDIDTKAAALLGLGKSYYARRDYTSAIDAYNRLLGQFPESDSAGNAYFLLGESYFDIGEYLQAASAYARFAELKPGALDDIARTYQGNAALAGGDYNQAIFAYQAALQAVPPGNTSYLNLQIGKAYAGLEDYTTAIQYYTTVYDTAQEDYSKSTANLLAGQAYLEIGLNDEAYTRFMDSVIHFPKAYDSFTALSLLVNNGIPVNDFYRGLVDYYAGSYDFATQAFQRYLDSNPDNNDGSVHYFKGLSHYFAGKPQNAIAEYETLINNYPGNPYWSAAWDEKAYVQWADLDQYTTAVETYKGFVSFASTSLEAPTFLFEAGRVYERGGNLEEAAITWQRMMNEYPSAELSYRGLFLAGISYYRLSRYEESLSVFQRCLVLGTTPADKAKAYLWIGKAFQATGKADDARNAWELAKNADPTDYYSIRAMELLDSITMFDITEGIDLGYDLAFERPEAESWLRSTFTIPTETDLSGLGDLISNQRLNRISQLLGLGLFKEAINEAEILRGELQGDVVNSYRLMNFLVEKHLYQPAIYISRNILNLAGMDDLTSLTAPIYFTHIRFGAYYRDLIMPVSNDYDIPPLLLYALVRQESMFNPFIISSAGATGLAQIMPATGRENVNLLDWPPDYEDSDLKLGKVNITLCAYYLDRMRTYLNGNLQAALAAYNAGPGNSESWFALSNNDPDLFLEVLRAQETQNYLMQITEFLNIYKLIYSRPQ